MRLIAEYLLDILQIAVNDPNRKVPTAKMDGCSQSQSTQRSSKRAKYTDIQLEYGILFASGLKRFRGILAIFSVAAGVKPFICNS